MLCYLDVLEDDTGAVSGGSSFTLGLADWCVVLMKNGHLISFLKYKEFHSQKNALFAHIKHISTLFQCVCFLVLIH